MVRYRLENDSDYEQINAFYAVVKPTFANCLLFLITFWKPPQVSMEAIVKRRKTFCGETKTLSSFVVFCTHDLFV